MDDEHGSRLTPEDESAFREMLAAEHDRTLAQIGELTRAFAEIVEASSGANIDDEHDPEGSTIAYERSQVSALLGQARGHLDAVDRALARLREGAYGSCERCARPIARERLSVRPTAPMCVDCASATTRRR